MNAVRTVLGDIDSERLGVTATHEHLICDQRLCRDGDRVPKGNAMVLQDMDLAVDELAPFQRAGGQALVEVTVRGWGRDVGRLAAISRRTGVHIVATAGCYVEPCLPLDSGSLSVDELAEELGREIDDGADGTSHRAGLLKSALSHPTLQGVEAHCARAVARAAIATGAAITTHTSGSVRFHIRGGNGGHLFLDLFEREGVRPERVIIGHCDENADIRQLLELLVRGAYIQFDVIGKEHWLLDATRVDLVLALVERGYAERILLSSDRARPSELKSGGGIGYDHVLTAFVPALRDRGIDDQAIDLMVRSNPARALALAPISTTRGEP
jgi:predicted metal-dependent phosphotriesterase family hydrolase